MHGVGRLAQKGFEFMEIIGFEIYGAPGSRGLEMTQRAAGGVVSVTVKPQRLGGYIRPRSG